MHIDDYLNYFAGATDSNYLIAHYPRFQQTQKLAYLNWKWQKANVLDVGAHWLHQSLLYALDGHQVTAADFSDTFEDPAIHKIASDHRIQLLGYEDLSSSSAFDDLDDDSIDVILFCEILEHITFNPVGMWRTFYRILRPGGRIIITTPNYYSLKCLIPSLSRFFSGGGVGISVSEILHKKSYAHHWKEFSMNELRRYFESLSGDFDIQNQRYCSFNNLEHLNWKGQLAYNKKNLIPFFRKGLYMEIDLPMKGAGIVIEPDW
jgi:2-polyprenyl-6-hydroxyphenyl methylase/3-demethylubiquinone-9 3-methyltransferase